MSILWSIYMQYQGSDPPLQGIKCYHTLYSGGTVGLQTGDLAKRSNHYWPLLIPSPGYVNWMVKWPVIFEASPSLYTVACNSSIFPCICILRMSQYTGMKSPRPSISSQILDQRPLQDPLHLLWEQTGQNTGMYQLLSLYQVFIQKETTQPPPGDGTGAKCHWKLSQAGSS